jgi:hypothetical protein
MKIETRILCWVTFFFRKLSHLWHNAEKYGGCKMLRIPVWRMRVAFWISKATRPEARSQALTHTQTHTHTHTECVMLIAFPRKQWFRKRVSVLC